MLAIPARVIATCFALACFAGSIAVGLYNGNEPLRVLALSLAISLPTLFVGWIIGMVAQHAVDDHIRRHKQLNPIPGEETDDDAASPDAARPRAVAAGQR